MARIVLVLQDTDTGVHLKITPDVLDMYIGPDATLNPDQATPAETCAVAVHGFLSELTKTINETKEYPH